MRLAVVGGGAAGFFLAINVKAMAPALEVSIFERQRKVLAKVAISGGGRCNCTNTFAGVTDLRQVYPRGANLLKRLFRQFGPSDTYRWFEQHGVPLAVQDDGCVFPAAQDSHAIVDCFLREARRLGVGVHTSAKVDDPTTLLADHDFVAVTTGGMAPHRGLPEWLSAAVGEGGAGTATEPVPSLFTFTAGDAALTALMGTVADNAIVSIPATRFRAQGPLLVTHWGLSGPAVLRLSSHAARWLAERQYRSPLLVNWVGESDADRVRRHLADRMAEAPQRLIDNVRPYPVAARLWDYLLAKAGVGGKRCGELGRKGLNRLVEQLTNDPCRIDGRSPYRDEFVTCGGVPLDSVDRQTLASKTQPRLYYAGEVLDIDGVTGGFNFQAAWTTAYAVALAIRQQVEGHQTH